MVTLSADTDIISILEAFAPAFTAPGFRLASTLLIGAILTVGRRTVASVLRTLGLSHDKHFQNYHRLLNRARWSSLQCAGILFRLLVAAFVPQGPLVLGGDETLERRQGAQIAKKGVYRDAARSSRSFFVKFLCQIDGLTLGLSDAVGSHSLGSADLGAPLSERSGSLGAL